MERSTWPAVAPDFARRLVLCVGLTLSRGAILLSVMKARLLVSLLLAVTYCAGKAEPRERPRLAPQEAGEKHQEVDAEPRMAQQSLFAPRFRSFESYLQAEARRPVGLEAVRENSGNGAARSRDANPAAARKDAAVATGAEVLVLPTVEITAKKVPDAMIQLADIESQVRSGEKASEETWLDSILNPALLPALLGGETAKARAARAKRRAEVLGWEKVLLLSFEMENSPAEKARIKADVEMLNTILRSWK